MKRILIPIAALLLVAFFWKTMSRRETDPTESTAVATPTPAVTERAPNSVAPAPAAILPNPATAAVEAFEDKRRAAGNENAPPLPAPMDAFGDVPKSELHSLGRRSFHVLGMTAVTRDHYSSQMGKLYSELNGFAIIEAKTGDGTWENAIFHSDARPVLLSPDGRMAIVTGTLVVKVNDLASVEDIAARDHLALIAKDESTRTAYLKVPDGYAVLEGQKRLQANAQIERVEIELFQDVQETN